MSFSLSLSLSHSLSLYLPLHIGLSGPDLSQSLKLTVRSFVLFVASIGRLLFEGRKIVRSGRALNFN